MENEQWKAIFSHAGFYEVSDKGRVRRLPSVLEVQNRWGPCKVRRAGGILKHGRAGTSGKYAFVQLCLGGKIKSRTVHTLVCEAFVSPRPEGMQCAHLDGDTTNNSASNLAWVSAKENQSHRIAHGTANRGDSAHQSILTIDAVRAIRARRAAGDKLKDIAADYGVHLSTIGHAISGKNWPDA